MRTVSALTVRLDLPLSFNIKPRPVNSEMMIRINNATKSTFKNMTTNNSVAATKSSSIPQHEKPARRPNLIQFNFGPWRFSAPLVPILAAIFIAAFLTSLGFWQLDRAAQKESLQSSFDEQMSAEPMAVTTAHLVDAPEKYLNVSVRGKLVDGAQQFLLDNRVNTGEAGYEVLAPLLLEDGGVLLVNRGWLPVGASRDIKPAVELLGQEVEIKGIAAKPSERFSLGDALLTDDAWPKVLQYEDFDAIGEALNLKLIPRVMQPSETYGWSFERIWQAVEADSSKNYGYALQWFALALAFAVLVGFVCIKKIKAD